MEIGVSVSQATPGGMQRTDRVVVDNSNEGETPQGFYPLTIGAVLEKMGMVREEVQAHILTINGISAIDNTMVFEGCMIWIIKRLP